MGRKYTLSYYRLRKPRRHLFYELSRIAAFDDITIESGPQKNASRFDLLRSTAYQFNVPNSSQSNSAEPRIHELETDIFEIIQDNGHLSCGFIPLNLLREDILAGSTRARRSFAIQVRIVSPSKIGVAKGMLFAKEGIDKVSHI